MSPYTESEQLTASSLFAFKLRKMYLKSSDLFYQVADIVPNLIFIQQDVNDDYSGMEYEFSNQRGSKYDCPEFERAYDIGGSYLPKISHPVLWDRLVRNVKIFKANNDSNKSLNYFQGMLMNGVMTYNYSSKLILDNNSFFNVTNLVSEIAGVQKVFSSIFDSTLGDLRSWQRFQSLTKQEKIIIRLLAQGFLNKEVANQLFISEDTVKTHRKNIYQKLSINNSTDLVRIALALDIIN